MSDLIGHPRAKETTLALLAARLARFAAAGPAAPPARPRADPHAHEFDFEHYVRLAERRREASAKS